MKLYKKLLLSLLTLFVFISLSSCNQNAKIPTANPSEPITSFPTLDAYHKLSDAEKEPIDEAIYNNTVEFAEGYFKEKIEKYLSDKTVLSLLSLDIYENNLLIDSKNRKVFNNLFINLEISLNDTNMSLQEETDFTDIIDKEIGNMLSTGDVFGFFKLNTLNINFINYKSKSKYGYVNTYSQSSDYFKAEQSEEELEARTIAYDFAKSSNNTLQKFGAIEDTKELYIEIYLIDFYRADGKDMIVTRDEILAQTDASQKTGEDLFGKIITNSSAKKYIEANGLTSVTISFFTTYLEEKYVTHNYEIK